MKKKIMIIEESLYEFAKRGRPKKKKSQRSLKKSKKIEDLDAWDSPEDEEDIDPDEIDIDTSDISNVEIIDIEEDVFDSELQKALSNEIKIPEFSRSELTFRLKGDLDKILRGVPMAKLGEGNAFLFKMKNGQLKKIFLRDIVLESKKGNDDRALTINE